jgi:hypothetical protein
MRRDRKNRVRVLNPAKPRKHLVRVLNPLPSHLDILSYVMNGSTEVDSLYQEFRGKPSEYSTLEEAAPGTPGLLAELGQLIELELDDGDVIEFDPEAAKLCADSEGSLFITGFREIDDEIAPGEKVYQGDITRVVYCADKPHLYPNEGEQDFEHWFGDSAGELPELHYLDGYYLIESGDYEIAERGIIN